jgi:hypothetical protein
MYHHERALRQSFNAHQSELLNTIADYRFLSPARMAAQARLERALTDQAIRRELGSAGESGSGRVRRWFGAWIVQVGTWLGGTAVPPTSRPLTADVAVTE